MILKCKNYLFAQPCSMLMLGGLGACPPRKFLKFSFSDIDFVGIFAGNLIKIFISETL